MRRRKRLVVRLVPGRGGSGWAVRGLPMREYSFDRKQDALDFARAETRQRAPSQLVVHGRDGIIQFEATYGQDPERYPS